MILQVIVVAPDSKFDMYWIIPSTAQQAFTHDFFHIDVRNLLRCPEAICFTSDPAMFARDNAYGM